ncbi:hypothetical protein TWF730_004060 [Orbilia blumenaviensis]|uniref:Rhodopsin domain-containing protein n=1 Tax=Orbilia blumenaviensis TaxID=1796055 RepID=A0AAV9U1N7_9PEZI
MILQPVTLNFIKLSILSFYLRLPGSNRFLILTRITFAFIVAMMLAFTLPLSLGSLKVERRQKIMVLCIFGCGSIATIASILALAELPLAINDPDKTWGSWRLAVYAAVENNLGIIAASAPALKPLLGKTARVVRGTFESKLPSNSIWTFSKSSSSRGQGRSNGGGGGGESRGSSGVKRSKASSASAGVVVMTNATDATTATSQSGTQQQQQQQSGTDNEKKHGFSISEVVKKIMSSPKSSLASGSGGGGRSSASRTGNTSYHTAFASRSHRESAILDTIGILPTQAAFPKNTSGNRRTTRVFAGNYSSDSGGRPTEIHHIRDWQLDQNDYCLDPTVEHNLPQRPQRVYSRASIDSSAGTPEGHGNGNGNGNGSDCSGGGGGGVRKTSQVDSIGSAVSPTTAVARRDTLEMCGEGGRGSDEEEEEEEAGLTIERILSHEEWKKSGGYV